MKIKRFNILGVEAVSPELVKINISKDEKIERYSEVIQNDVKIIENLNTTILEKDKEIEKLKLKIRSVESERDAALCALSRKSTELNSENILDIEGKISTMINFCSTSDENTRLRLENEKLRLENEKLRIMPAYYCNNGLY